jgi:hypothetical protein
MRASRLGVRAGRWLTGGLLLLLGGLLIIAPAGCAGSMSPAGAKSPVAIDRDALEKREKRAGGDTHKALGGSPSETLPAPDKAAGAIDQVPADGDGLAATTGGARSPLAKGGKEGGESETSRRRSGTRTPAGRPSPASTSETRIPWSWCRCM